MICQFDIDNDGNRKADFNFEFKEDENPWRYQDYSREKSVSAKRARMLAIPESKGEIIWSTAIYDKHLQLIKELQKTDFSFNYRYNDAGKWN